MTTRQEYDYAEGRDAASQGWPRLSGATPDYLRGYDDLMAEKRSADGRDAMAADGMGYAEGLRAGRAAYALGVPLECCTDPGDYGRGWATGWRQEAAERPRPDAQSDNAIASALKLLRQARDLLRVAGAPRAAEAVTRALKSADGAQRHARGLADRRRT